MVIACIALAVALSGTSYAAIKLPKNSVGTKQLKKNAVTSPKVKNNALTGADVNEASLGQVPSAASATSATNATNATNADHATAAGTANAAFSTFKDGVIDLPSSLGTIVTLGIPAPGNYVITANFQAHNSSSTSNINSLCSLGPSTGGGDTTNFDVDGLSDDDDEIVVLQSVSQFTAAGQVVLRCTDFGVGTVLAIRPRVRAVQVAQLTNTPF